MRRIDPWDLWLGHAGEARGFPALSRIGIRALVDLALNEPPLAPPREWVYARFPLVDGVPNAPAIVEAALQTTTLLVRRRVHTLLFCSAGMSRSPAIAAGALALLTSRPPQELLHEVIRGGSADVSPPVWSDVLAALAPGDCLEYLRR